MLRIAERRKRAAYPERSSGGPQRLLVLGSEIAGRWNELRLRHADGKDRNKNPNYDHEYHVQFQYFYGDDVCCFH